MASGISLSWLLLKHNPVKLVSLLIISGTSLIWLLAKSNIIKLVSLPIASGISTRLLFCNSSFCVCQSAVLLRGNCSLGILLASAQAMISSKKAVSLGKIISLVFCCFCCWLRWRCCKDGFFLLIFANQFLFVFILINAVRCDCNAIRWWAEARCPSIVYIKYLTSNHFITVVNFNYSLNNKTYHCISAQMYWSDSIIQHSQNDKTALIELNKVSKSYQQRQVLTDINL